MMSAERIEPTSLEKILSDVGSGMLKVVVNADSLDNTAMGLVIYDPALPTLDSKGEILLAVGVGSNTETLRLLGQMQETPAAIVVASVFEPSGELVSEATRRSVPILALHDDSSWLKLVSVFLIAFTPQDPSIGSNLDLSGEQLSDLFAIANAISLAVNAPVTIEDTGSRVLAFSARQEETDKVRHQTVLSSQVPDLYTARMRERGLFQRVYTADHTVFISSTELGFDTSRAAMAVRAGPEVLGAIWVATEHPLTPERAQVLEESSNVVALQILRHRARTRLVQRARSDSLKKVLGGGIEAENAARHLGITKGSNVVIAIEPAEDYEGVRTPLRTADEDRLTDLVDLHIQTFGTHAVSARVDDTMYAVLPTHPENPARQPLALAKELQYLLRPMATRIAIGRTVGAPKDLHISRLDVDRVLRVLRFATGSSLEAIENVSLQALLLEVDDLTFESAKPEFPPLVKLAAYDRAKDSELLRTLEVWLEEMGDLSATAERLHLHVNTCRYRVRRVAEVSGADLKCHEERLMLMLHMWLRRHRGDGLALSAKG